jgi:hypothetical protein
MLDNPLTIELQIEFLAPFEIPFLQISAIVSGTSLFKNSCNSVAEFKLYIHLNTAGKSSISDI